MREHVRRVRHADHRRVAPVADREHAVAAGERLGDQLRRLGVDLVLVEVDELHARLGRRRPDQVLFGDEAELAQDVAERRPVAACSRSAASISSCVTCPS